MGKTFWQSIEEKGTKIKLQICEVSGVRQKSGYGEMQECRCQCPLYVFSLTRDKIQERSELSEGGSKLEPSY